jgi:hypothetical protein
MPYTNRFPRALRLAACLLLAASWPAIASDLSDLYASLYESAQTLQQKQDVMTSLGNRTDPDFAPFLIKALDGLVAGQRSVSSATEKILNAQIMRTIVKKLGDLHSRDAAPLVLTVVKEAEDPVLKADALTALGNIGIASYAERIAMMLRDLNMNPGGNAQSAEIVAAGCIAALERLREKVGYIPVFDASMGWYSRWVKDAAGSALRAMVEDPSEMLAEILGTDTSLPAMLRALETEAASSAPAAGKIMVALAALDQTGIREGKNAIEKTLLAQIRTTAVSLLSALKADTKEVLSYLSKLLSSDSVSTGEKIGVIEALGAAGSKEAASVLIAYLKWTNDRKASDIMPKDDRLLRATIRVLGAMKRPEAAPEIIRVKILDYSLGPTRDAEDALKKIGM